MKTPNYLSNAFAILIVGLGLAAFTAVVSIALLDSSVHANTIALEWGVVFVAVLLSTWYYTRRMDALEASRVPVVIKTSHVER